MNTLFANITNFSLTHTLIKPGDTIIVGLSGGPDSVFLLHWLHAYAKNTPITLIAAHLNHGWRAESGADEQFCAQLATSLAIPFVSKKAADITLNIKKNGSQEAYGRALRRAFFAQVKAQYNATAIALAHHADDQLETFFIRLIRGATITGLASMRPAHGHYIRPMLTICKADVLEYLKKNNIPYRIDHTNGSPDFLRNRIRHQVIPALAAVDNRAVTKSLETITHLQETEQFLTKLTDQTWQALSATHDGQLRVKLPEFRALQPFLQARFLIHWLIQEQATFTPSESFLEEMQRFLLSPRGGSHTLGPWKMVKQGNGAWIEKISI
ncbi:MAG: tRNA lysidine(34) synthetase TilS [Candidatus Babeliales bacterium]